MKNSLPGWTANSPPTKLAGSPKRLPRRRSSAPARSSTAVSRRGFAAPLLPSWRRHPSHRDLHRPRLVSATWPLRAGAQRYGREFRSGQLLPLLSPLAWSLEASFLARRPTGRRLPWKEAGWSPRQASNSRSTHCLLAPRVKQRGSASHIVTGLAKSVAAFRGLLPADSPAGPAMGGSFAVSSRPARVHRATIEWQPDSIPSLQR